jgi:hypothetical protein
VTRASQRLQHPARPQSAVRFRAGTLALLRALPRASDARALPHARLIGTDLPRTRAREVVREPGLARARAGGDGRRAPLANLSPSGPRTQAAPCCAFSGAPQSPFRPVHARGQRCSCTFPYFFFTLHDGHELAMSAARNEAYGPARVTKLGKQVGRLKRGTGSSAVPWQA